MTMLSSGVSTTHDRNRAWSVTPPGRYPDTGMLAAQDCTKSAPEPPTPADETLFESRRLQLLVR